MVENCQWAAASPEELLPLNEYDRKNLNTISQQLAGKP